MGLFVGFLAICKAEGNCFNIIGMITFIRVYIVSYLENCVLKTVSADLSPDSIAFRILLVIGIIVNYVSYLILVGNTTKCLCLVVYRLLS
jgi:hypothetical protein